MTLSGALVLLWIGALYGSITGIWWVRLDTYFDERGNAGGVTLGNNLLAAIALTGHYADVTLGMVLLPVSRHSALASFFKLSVSTTLTYHMLTAYLLFTFVLIHAFLYISWVPLMPDLSSTPWRVFPLLNPTYLYDEVWPDNTSSLGIWRASLVFSGAVAALIMVILALTTLPWVRLRHFNVFYFTHLLSIVAVVVVCLHASTLFYCTAPGIAMLILDWGMRLYELRQGLDGKVCRPTTPFLHYVVNADIHPRSHISVGAGICKLAPSPFIVSLPTLTFRFPVSPLTYHATASPAAPANLP